jgi:WD40 repeat protein
VLLWLISSQAVDAGDDGAKKKALAAPSNSPEAISIKTPENVLGQPLPSGARARLGTLTMRRSGTRGMVFTSSGDRLAAWGSGPIHIYDLLTGETRLALQNESSAGPLALRDERGEIDVMFSRGSAGSLRSGKESLKEHGSFKYSAGIMCARFSHDGKVVVCGAGDGSVLVCDRSSGKILTTARTGVGVVRDLSLSFNDRLLAVAGERGVELFELWTAVPLLVRKASLFSTEKREVCTVALSANGKTLVVGRYYEKAIDVIDTDSQERTALKREFGTRTVAISKDGVVAQGGEGGTVHVYDRDTKSNRFRFDVGKVITHLAFSADGTLLAASAGLFDQEVRVWDIKTGKERFDHPRHDQPIEQIAFSPDGKLVATAAKDRTLRVWNAETGRHLFQIDKRKELSANIAVTFFFARSSKHLSFASGHVLEVWGLESQKKLRGLSSQGVFAGHSMVSPDGTHVAAAWSIDVLMGTGARSTSIIAIHDVASGATVRELTSQPLCYGVMGFSQDGRMFATTHWKPDRLFSVLWDAGSGERLHEVEGIVVALARDPKRLTVWDGKGTIRSWHTDRGDEAVLEGWDKRRPIAFSADGQFVAGGVDGHWPVEVVELRSGRVIGKVKGDDQDDGRIAALAVSPDGRRIATAGKDGTALIWDVAANKR